MKTILLLGHGRFFNEAAISARLANDKARIVMLNKNEHEPEQEALVKPYNVDLKTKVEALALDADASCLHVLHEGRAERFAYDALVYMGELVHHETSPKLWPAHKVLSYFDEHYEAKLLEAKARGARRIVILGCNYFALRIVQNLANEFSSTATTKMTITIIDRAMRVLPEFSLSLSETIASKLAEAFIGLIRGQVITDACDSELVLGSGQKIEADLLILTEHAQTKNDILSEAQVALDNDGYVRVDDFMATTLPEVYACAHAVKLAFNPLGERQIPKSFFSLKCSAELAAFNASTTLKKKRMPLLCQSLMFKVADTYFARTGLSEAQLRLSAMQDDYIVSTTHDVDHLVRLLINKNNQTILGAELYAHSSVERCIDILTLAVREQWPLDFLLDLEMASLSLHAVDPLRLAAIKAIDALKHKGSYHMSEENFALWLKTKNEFSLIDVSEGVLRNPAHNIWHIPLHTLPDSIDKLRALRQPIVLCSEKASLNQLAQRLLHEHGLHEVYDLDGGYSTLRLLLDSLE